MTVRIPYEPDLKPGPIGKYIAVIDYDGVQKKYYRPVNLNEASVLLSGGIDPSESNPQFHQQMVYAVVNETVRRFEFALGRRIRWRRGGDPKDPLRQKLKVFPHAIAAANAFYDREMRALLFGYFAAESADFSVNLPGQLVFTCLSHDVVAHEATHALVDGLREHFTEPTSLDTPAFHEAFADIIALFQHFSYKEALLETIQRSGGFIHAPQLAPETSPGNRTPLVQTELTPTNPMVELARQFGEAMGPRKALRAALGTPPESLDIDVVTEPHVRGSILVAAIFDAFFTIYIRRTRDLLRIARAGGLSLTAGDLNSDLANRLAGEATKTAQHFQNICIRALDYCPPVDIQFGDFLRALITADTDLVQEDPFGYRAAIAEAFRLRGIRPVNAASWSEESLCWPDPEGGISPCQGLQPQRGAADPSFRGSYIALSKFGKANAAALGLSQETKVQAFSFRPVHRVGPDGQLRLGYVAELVQKRDKVPLDPQDAKSPTFTFHGGSTLLLDADGTVRYAIAKGLDDEKRLAAQRGYYERLATSMAATAYREPPEEIFELPFAAIHRGF
jgi:hypothetical protein